MYNIINKAHVYDLPKRPSQTTTSAGKSFHGTVRRTRDPRKHIIDARSRAKLRRVRIHAMIPVDPQLFEESTLHDVSWRPLQNCDSPGVVSVRAVDCDVILSVSILPVSIPTLLVFNFRMRQSDLFISSTSNSPLIYFFRFYENLRHLPALKINTEETRIKQKKNDRETYNLTNNIEEDHNT